MVRLGDFSPIRLLFKLIVIFCGGEIAQKCVTTLGTNLLNFNLNMQFKNIVCILTLLSLATVLATFKKIGHFFKSSGHPDRLG